MTVQRNSFYDRRIIAGKVEMPVQRHNKTGDGVKPGGIGRPEQEVRRNAGQRSGLELRAQILGLVMGAGYFNSGVLGQLFKSLKDGIYIGCDLGVLLLPDHYFF